jgi:hypothetical protein
MDIQSIFVTLNVNKRSKNPVSLSITIVDDIDINDIDLFVKSAKGSSRDNNDCNNKKREKILSILPILPKTTNKNYQQFLKDERWTSVYTKFMELLNCLIEKEGKEYDRVNLIHKAGRSHNFDFEVLYYKDEKVVYIVEELEFKNGCNNMETQVPQQLSLQTNSEYGNFVKKFGLYDEYFYENYLPKIMECYQTNNVVLPSIPSLCEYKKLVKGINYDAHPLFITMKHNEKKVTSIKSKLVDESIDKYLKGIHKDAIDFDSIQKKLQHSQGNKTFVLWDTKNFNVNHVKKDELQLNRQFQLKYGKNSLANTLVLHTENKNKSWEFLLRWRNHKGILNPAWQIKLRCVK